ncbi:ABC transporter ATP-binding protein [Pseudoroseicyclus sp. CXY001]|uniref:ABC transporter ATP-binding protein n=1 Tax=Pseudoroseicyclus sp. CXY001 TaxID=3242492 RepID=UPI003570F536
MSLLTCEALTVSYPGGGTPVRGASFAVAPGECFALVGCSGSGKSTIARALLGLHGAETRLCGGLRLGGRDLLTLDAAGWRQLRGREIGYVGQNPWSACDPLRPVRDHVDSAWRAHGLSPPPGAAEARLTALGIPEAAARLPLAPHAWSGGMLQRASIAAAHALAPRLVVADEPTSALDADRAEAVLAALKGQGAVLLISHDIALVMRMADRIGILHEGRIVETGTPEELRRAPAHDETRRLLGAAAPLPKGAAPGRPPLLFRGEGLARDYAGAPALPETDLQIGAGEIVGIKGPSGCGKSTLLRLVMGLEPPTRGRIERAPALQRPAAIMPVFQDPVSSLVPHWPIWRSVAEPLVAGHRARTSRRARRAAALAALAEVGLGEIDPEARPGELSVGQCQRCSLSRALVAEPALIVADEPSSALDSLATAGVARLLRQAADRGTAVLLVSHDGAFLERLADRIVALGGEGGAGLGGAGR